MADEQAKGVRDVTAAADELKQALSAMLDPTKRSTAAQKAYTEQMTKGAAETKKSTQQFTQLAKILPTLQKNTAAYTSTVEFAANKLVEEQKLLVTSGQKQHEEEMSFIKESIAALRNKGSMDKDSQVQIAALHAKGRELEKANMMARLENTVAIGKASGAFGPVVKGMVAQVQQHGVKIATMAGDVMGATGSQMASLAAGATIAVGVFMALKAVIEGVAGAARDAAEGGLELSSGLETQYMAALRRATTRGGIIQVLPQQEVFSNLKAMTSEFVYDVGLTGREYENLLNMSKSDRNERRLMAIGFVADAMLVGKAYGIQGEEAVKMATRMGTLGRGPIKEVLGNFTLLAEESRRLGIPMQLLMGTMEGLSTVSYGLNLTVGQLTQQTLNMFDAMSKASDQGMGFRDMRAEDIQKHVAGFVRSINSIDPRRLMALTQTRGGTFGGALDRVVDKPLETLRAGVASAAKAMGTSLKDTSNIGAYKLSAALGLQGNERELVMAGKEVRAMMRNNTFNPESLKEIQGRILDSKFDQSKTVGQNIAQGADVMQVIAGTLSNILKVMVEATNRIFQLPFFSSTGGSKTARQLETAQRAQGYGRAAGGGRGFAVAGA